MPAAWKRRGACVAAVVLAAALIPLTGPDRAALAASARIVVDDPAPNALQKAIDSAPPGAKIRVRRGLYREALVIEKPVRIVGVGKGRPTIDAACAASAAIEVTSPGVTLRRLRVIGAATHAEVDFSGVASGRAQALRLRDSCDAAYGINVFASGALTISDNSAHGFSDAGIYIGGITDTLGGTLLASDNHSHGNNKGIIVEDSAGGDVRIQRNVVHDNTLSGVGVPTGIFVHASDGVLITHNVVLSNGSLGIHLTADADGNRLFANVMAGNETDLLDEGAGNCGSGNVVPTGTDVPPC